MTKTLIIYAHPNKDGYCGEFLKRTEEQLKERKEDYELIDLYKDGYNPNLLPNEHYTSGHYDVAPENKAYQKKIEEAKHLIFIYPIWWQNMPAILKGFLDRVFIGRWAFKFNGKMPEGLLKGRKAVAFTSAGGPRIFTRLFTGDRGMKVLVKDTLKFCGIKAKGYNVGNASKMTDKGKVNVKKTVKKGLRFLY